MGADVLTSLELNRATLARQLLLERSSLPVLDAVAHLVGLQAQEPSNPHVALWSRLAGYEPADLDQLLVERAVVRVVVMRGTVHLVTAEDCLGLRPHLQPVLDAELTRHPEAGPAIDGLDLEPVLAFARTLLADRPRSMRDLRAEFARQLPDLDAAGLAYACRNLITLVQLPPRGLWGKSAGVIYATAEDWLGCGPDPAPSIDDLVFRYFAAFGPATVADVTAWSRLTGLRDVVERLRPRLRSFRDERGRELFDLPDAPRPRPDVPAPVRFLPEYDNVLLSHADRSRFAGERRAQPWAASGPVRGSLLHDGRWAGTWRTERADKSGPLTLVVDHEANLPRRALREVQGEATGLLDLYEGDDIRLVAVG